MILGHFVFKHHDEKRDLRAILLQTLIRNHHEDLLENVLKNEKLFENSP